MTGILGLDLSLTGTGLALITDDLKISFADAMLTAPTPRLIRQEPRGAIVLCTSRLTPPEHYSTFQRWSWILAHVQNWAAQAETVIIEGYSLGSHMAQSRAIAELGGIIRYHLYLADRHIVEIPPTVLKKFLTEKGNSDKSIVLKEVLRRYSFNVDDHNIADAFGLAKIGEAMFNGTEGLPQFQVEIIEQLKNPKPKKKKARA